MAKKRKKLTSPDENLDPDAPTELELRLEEELRLVYEAERLIKEGGGLKDLVAMHDETLTLICDTVERSRIGEEVELEKVLEQLTKEELVVIVKEALGKDKELEESVKKRFGFLVLKRVDNNDVKTLDQKQKRLVSCGQAVANVEKRHLNKGQDQLLVSSRRDALVVVSVERRHLDEGQDQLRVSSRRDGHMAANVERRHLNEGQDQLQVSSRRDENVAENVKRRHLDEGQDQLRVSSRRDGRGVGSVERRHLDEGQDQLRVSSRRDGRVVGTVERRHLDEAQNQLRVLSRRDGRVVGSVERRHLDEARNQLRRNEKPEFTRNGHQKGKREKVTMPKVGAFGTTGAAAAYLTSYGDKEQLHCLSWTDDYQNKYLPSGYWQGQHWYGFSAYDPTLSGARTFNPDFGQASRQVAADYWPNSFQDGTHAAPINQPGSPYSYNARYGNMHDGYWRQYMQPHSIYEDKDNRHHRWPIRR